MIVELLIETNGKGLYEITEQVNAAVKEVSKEKSDSGGEGDGLCVVFVRHTSASIIIQENADPSARRDLEQWLDRLVPERDPLYTHTAEGPDDMPAHLKAALTATSVSIPLSQGKLLLGVWQGIYLWEHRRARQTRRVVVWVG